MTSWTRPPFCFHEHVFVQGGHDVSRREVEQLRADLHEMQNKNHQLVEDNIKLTEHLNSLEKRVTHSYGPTQHHEGMTKVHMYL